MALPAASTPVAPAGAAALVVRDRALDVWFAVVCAAGKRRQLITVLFEAEDERYQWLNSAVCVLEGVLRTGGGTMNTRVYTCVHELD